MTRLLTASLALALGSAAVACDDYEMRVHETPAAPVVELPDSPVTPDPVIPDPVIPDPVIPDPVIPDPVEPPPQPVIVTPINVSLLGEEAAALLPPEPEPETPTRPRRRMDIDQLDRAITQVTGGFAWTEIANNGTESNLFVRLASTLGKPDYIQQTEEDTEPSALFQKFLGEAARTVCDRLVTAEVAGQTDDPVIFTAATPTDTPEFSAQAVDDNLAALLMRFHSKRLAPGSPGFQHWRWLFESALHIAGEPVTAWRTVCAGLIMHPDFYTY